MRILTIINLKGGTAKTTTVINLALNMATMHNKRVLIVDNDIQGNVSKFFDVHSYDEKGVEEIYRNGAVNTSELIRPSSRTGLDIIPANMNLDAAATDLMLTVGTNQITRLRDALRQVEGEYDYCLIDCPPGVGINVLNALAAADDVMIPIKIDKCALDGMEELAEVIEEIRQFNPSLKIIKCLVTMFTKDIAVIKGEDALKESKYSTFTTHIRYSKRVVDWTLEKKRSLKEVTPRSAATRDYKNLTLEYMDVTIGGIANGKDRNRR